MKLWPDEMTAIEVAGLFWLFSILTALLVRLYKWMFEKK